MTLTIGLWVVPAIITLAGLVHVGTYKPTGHYDVGGAIIAFGWLIAIVVAWAMWGLSWLA